MMFINRIDTKQVESTLSTQSLAKGLEKYLWLINSLHQVNVAEDREYQRRYNGYYKIRQRSVTFYKDYYNYLETKKKSGTTFEDTLSYLHNTCGSYESSFSSKLVAMIDPTKPVWDQHVMRNMGIKVPYTYTRDRMSKIIDAYQELGEKYQRFLDSEKAKLWISMFDKKFPQANITNLKKIDLILWQMRE